MSSHPSETPLAVKVHTGRKGFIVLHRETQRLIGNISFESLHKMHHGMQEIAGGKTLVYESKSDYGHVLVSSDGSLFHIHAKPYDKNVAEVDAVVSMKTIDLMIIMIGDFLSGALEPDKLFAIHPEMVAASEFPVTA